MLFWEVNYEHRKKMKYMVLFRDFRCMKVFRDEKGIWTLLWAPALKVHYEQEGPLQMHSHYPP